MTSLRNIKTLISRSDASVRRCDMRRVGTERQLRENEEEAASLQQQKNGLRQLIEQERPSGMLDKARLFLCQHRIAVFMQKIKELEVQEKKLLQTRDDLTRQLAALRTEKLHWERKHKKYLNWADQRKKAFRLTGLRQEEDETQEIITWSS
ncbi:hypothetical protein [Acerihabitans arboris]|uniref:Uncharacterized protein n=1 Tax=Acerihabitans arboris TaxID=2691583 RepID=A0A845SDP7_9GAMM|nr:hypothetical protein [Acerihabitans arboris]NDL61522.1 hypothetical protein [Acerihabitans arboris]